MSEANFQFSSNAKKNTLIALGVGVFMLALGILGLQNGWWGGRDGGHGHHDEVAAEPHGHSHEAGEAEEEIAKGEATLTAASEDHGHAAHDDHGHGSHEYHWSKRIKANFWLNVILFTGVSIIGVFFLAVNYVGWAGWSAILQRIFVGFGYTLIPAAVLLIGGFLVLKGDLFHWTHPEAVAQDHLLQGKAGFLNEGFFLVSSIAFFGFWFLFWFFMKNHVDKEDKEPGDRHYKSIIKWGAGFIVFFALSSSIAAWEWVMSIDAHWFSTMFGWYVFASWFVTGLAVITLFAIYLKKAGLLPQVNENHIHNLGLFMFAFSIFWSYIWFSQFLLIWYANIPEESIYYVERLFMNDGVYIAPWVLTLLINFLFPFLFLMTRKSKRQMTLVKVAAYGLIIGHWMDFYLMIFPGTIQKYGGFDAGTMLVELGMTTIFASILVYVVLFGMSRRPIVAKNHPLLEESLHHQY